MSNIPHIPALRRERAYQSLDKAEVKDCRTGEVKAIVSQVNAGIVRKDLQRIAQSRAALNKFTVAQLVEICAKAGEVFLNGTLPVADQGHARVSAQRAAESRPDFHDEGFVGPAARREHV